MNPNGHLLLVLVYVNDIIITGSSSDHIQKTIQDMQQTFALKDLGELNYFMGIEVTKLETGIHVTSQVYC